MKSTMEWDVPLTEREEELLSQLRANAEGPDEDGWRLVYLDNCPMCQREHKSFAALCGCLTKKGYYREEDYAWGSVRVS